MRPRRAGSGFTLIEALVVAVLMSILAAVSIPIYSGYITSQRQQAAQTMAQTAATAANTYFRRNNASPTVAQLNLYAPAGQFSITIDAATRTITVQELSKPNPTVSATATY